MTRTRTVDRERAAARLPVTCTLETCDKDTEGMGNDEDEDSGP